MSRVNFNATQDYQYLTNYKILQSGFSKHKITREVPVERLMKFRLQDNLEFLQWMSKMWAENKLDDYDPMSRRKSTVVTGGGRRVVSGSGSVRRTSLSTSAASNHHSSGGSTLNVNKQRPSRSSYGSSTSSRTSSAAASNSRFGRPTNGTSLHTPTQSGGSSTVTQRELAKSLEECKELKAQIEESKQVQENLESERNFYFVWWEMFKRFYIKLPKALNFLKMVKCILKTYRKIKSMMLV
ncbi:unnamed protein product [Ambrosiozyma monospora]|uniref:Unnamed protein product n=1 Tax=Ambrosiozyma monospora TaxID=43982 RepID=A0ACB5U888_AMBMO|nr:unnamed protein product [Ambrosiozyma monospora]